MARRHRSKEEDSRESVLINCADLILPWLRPSELAAVSSTCRTLNWMSKDITFRRAADASRGFEKFPIPFVNTVDHQPYAYFIYTPTQTRALPIFDDPSRFRQQWGSSPWIRRVSLPDPPDLCSPVTVEGAGGCECEEGCGEEKGCPCLPVPNPGELTRECGPSCLCGTECGNRLTQGGLSVRLKIVKDGRKGWGLRAGQVIRAGQFVCEYAGELLTTKEARMRQEIYDELASSGRFSSALLVVREHLPSGNACMRINIDATRIGNVARFINHSCDGGNLSTLLVRSSGALVPRLCFFAACRDIQKDEELTFSYGDVRLRSNGLRCFCNSSSCFGILPSEQT